MCSPSATSAIEPNNKPPTISAIIMKLHSAITVQVRRSLRSWPSPRKTWLWRLASCSVIGAAACREARRLFEVRLHRLDQFLGAAAAFGIPRRIDDMQADVVFDYLGHQARKRAARRDDQMQNGGAAFFFFERALNRFDLTAHPLDPVQEL